MTILKDSFNDIYHNPESNLSNNIWISIKKKESAKRLKEIYLFLGVNILSLMFLIFSLSKTFSLSKESGVYEYLSLLSSDISTVLIYWKEFILSVTQSIPFTEVAISLFMFYVFLVSLYKMSLQFKYKSRLLLNS